MTNDATVLSTQKMVILRGLPGAGKTTEAYHWVNEDADWRVRVSRDDLAQASYKKTVHELSRHQTDTIVHHETDLVTASLGAKLSVIIDDAINLKSETVKFWYNIADKYQVPVEVVDIDASLEDSLSRNRSRLFPVDDEIIRDFHKRYFKKGKPRPAPKHTVGEPLGRAYTPNPDLPKAVWLDVDGTVARMVDRPPFAWERVHEDEPITHVIEAVQALQKDNYKIVVMSGRDEVCKPATVEWLQKHGIEPDDVFMRPAGSYTPDDKVKHDLFWEHVAPKYDVRFALDDRQKVVDFTRDVLKIPVFQVAPGNF